MRPNKVYFHVGYPKTATSSLQKYVFPCIPDIDFVGKYEGEAEKFKVKALEDLLLSASTMSSRDFSVVEVYGVDFDRFSDSILISEEVILFNLLRPTLWRSDNISVTDIVANLKRVESILNVEFHIVITVRSQLDMIPSVYAQCFNSCYSRIPGLSEFNRFFDFFFNGSDFHKVLDYAYVINEFKSVFDNVNVLLYERSKDPVDFVRLFGQALNANVEGLTMKPDNVRRSGIGKRVDDYSLSDLLGSIRYKIPILRHVRIPFLRRLLHKVTLKDMSSLSESIVMSDAQLDYVTAFYRASNQKLSESLCVDLKKYGYPS